MDFDEQVKLEVQKKLSDPVYLQEKLLFVLQNNKQLIEAIESKELEIKALEPAKDFYDTVTKIDTWFEMSEVSKILNIQGYGRNKVFRLLRDHGVLRRNNEPYQRYVDCGYFKIVEEVYELPYGETDIYRKTVVSNKGIEHIKKIIQEDMAA